METYRAWINQPSTSQSLHHLHGKKCIANDDGGDYFYVYFTEGVVHSMRISRLFIERIHLSDAHLHKEKNK